MKKVLGAITAALLFGVGCAHGPAKTSRSESPMPQASAGSTVGTASASGGGGLVCEVFTPVAAAQGAQPVTPPPPPPAAPLPQDDSATGGAGDAWQEGQDTGAASDVAPLDNSLPGNVSGDGETPGGSINDNATGGTGSDVAPLPQEQDNAVGGAGAEEAPEGAVEETPPRPPSPPANAAPQGAFEDPGTGGAAGGGG